MSEAKDRVYKPQQYEAQSAITLGIFDLMPTRGEAVTKYAHYVLAGNLSHREARKLVAQYDSKQPLRDSLVRRLLERRHIEGIWATFYVRDGRLDATAVITVENPARPVLNYTVKITQSLGRVDPA